MHARRRWLLLRSNNQANVATAAVVQAPTIVSSGLFTQASRTAGNSGLYTTGTALTISGLSHGALLLFLANTGGTILGVTLNNGTGAAFTHVGTALDGGRAARMDIWYLLAPPDGTANAYIQVDASNGAYGANVLVALDHVDQTTPIEATGTGTNSASATASGTTSLVIAGCGWQFDATETVVAPATELQHNQNALANMAVAWKPGLAGAVSVAWSSSTAAVARAVSVKGA